MRRVGNNDKFPSCTVQKAAIYFCGCHWSNTSINNVFLMDNLCCPWTYNPTWSLPSDLHWHSFVLIYWQKMFVSLWKMMNETFSPWESSNVHGDFGNAFWILSCCDLLLTSHSPTTAPGNAQRSKPLSQGPDKARSTLSDPIKGENARNEAKKESTCREKVSRCNHLGTCIVVLCSLVPHSSVIPRKNHGLHHWTGSHFHCSVSRFCGRQFRSFLFLNQQTWTKWFSLLSCYLSRSAFFTFSKNLRANCSTAFSWHLWNKHRCWNFDLNTEHSMCLEILQIVFCVKGPGLCYSEQCLNCLWAKVTNMAQLICSLLCCRLAIIPTQSYQVLLRLSVLLLS